MSSEFEFKKGTKVEISIDEDGFRGAWFPGTVIKQPSKNENKVMVEYDTLLDESERNPLREKVDIVQIRPIPPRELKRVFKLDEEVDVYYNDGWWEGVITQVLEGEKCSVYFRPTREQNEFKECDMRLHREWVHQNWVPPLEDLKTVQPLEEKIHKEKEDKKLLCKGDLIEKAQPLKEEIHKEKEDKTLLCKGDLIEVSSDEDGFEGAWFSATLIEVIDKNKYLVEYNDLRTDDDKEFVREEVDFLHIRPRPPNANVHKFMVSQEVDALYNDGWWVGIISKVVSDSKYVVYFKPTDEQLEFMENELRVHQDWIDGKWVIASQALGLSD